MISADKVFVAIKNVKNVSMRWKKEKLLHISKAMFISKTAFFSNLEPKNDWRKCGDGISAAILTNSFYQNSYECAAASEGDRLYCGKCKQPSKVI